MAQKVTQLVEGDINLQVVTNLVGDAMFTSWVKNYSGYFKDDMTKSGYFSHLVKKHGSPTITAAIVVLQRKDVEIA